MTSTSAADLFVAALIGFFFWPLAEYLFKRWLNRPKPFNIDRDFRNACGKDCAIKG